MSSNDDDRESHQTEKEKVFAANFAIQFRQSNLRPRRVAAALF